MCERQISDFATINESTCKEDGSIKYLDTGNISSGIIDEIQSYDCLADAPSRARRKVLCGDIVYSTVRPNQKHYGFINKETEDLVVSTGFAVISVKDKSVNSKYVYYYLSQDNITDYLQSIAEQSTSAYPSITSDDIGELLIPLPTRATQDRIVNFIDSISNLMSTNLSTNDYLVEIAQELFTEQFGAMLLDDEPPAGWKKGRYDDIITIHDSKRIPLSGNERENMDRIYPYYGAASVAGYVDDYIFDGVYLLFGEDGTVIDEKGNPSLQYVWGKFWVNNHAHILTGRNGFSVESLFLLSKQLKVESIITGAVQPKISQNSMKNVALNIPPEYIISSFDEVIAPIFDQYRNNCDENQRLSILRDTLLPKLMSGEIDVSNLDLSS